MGLTETLVVLGIIAVLVSLALGAYQNSLSRAADVACLANLRQIGGMLQQFIVENNGFLPSSYRNSTGQNWFEQLADAASAGPGDYLNPTSPKNVFMCPASKLSWKTGNHGFHGNYGWNISYGNQWDESNPLSFVKRVRRDQLKAGEAAVIADVNTGPYSKPDGIHYFSNSGSSISFLDFRHAGGMRLHVLFVDGSTRSITRDEATSDFFDSTKHRSN